MPLNTTTQADIVARIDLQFDDAANAKWSLAEKQEAYNQAVRACWPRVKQKIVDSTLTLAATTFEYVPSNAVEAEIGWSVAYVTLPNNPKVLLRRVRQRLTSSPIDFIAQNPTIIVPRDVAVDYAGETLHLEAEVRYQPTHNSAKFVPDHYLFTATAYFLCLNKIVVAAHFDANPYRELAQFYKREMEDWLNANATRDLPRMIAWTLDTGRGETGGRYGQNIVANP